ncbi:unnamed protein product [Thelazia callipaeda]|uniref:G_PROTEIN_RECEP_F1_2 domain-containing protein n=1 Tax=Thelazia callipaeda TaxID=103827 RepID=A0A0N5DAA7_THECL|nr:unnamed protein product [Thelazia callipaeda]
MHFLKLACQFLINYRTNYWLKRLTSNIYLCTLSLCSCLFLSMVLLTWMDSILEVPIYNNSELGCKLLTFFAHMSDFNCVWMISWISCDRASLLFQPDIRIIVCSKTFARRMVYGTVLCSVIFYSWCLIVAGLEYNHHFVFCGLSQNLTFLTLNHAEIHFYSTIFDTVICTVVPSLLITVMNILAIYRYRQCMRFYSSNTSRVRFLKLSDRGVRNINLKDYSTNAKRLLLSQQSKTNQPSTKSPRPASSCKLRLLDLQLSRSLLIVTSTFVCLTVPNYGFRLYISTFDPQSALFHFAYFGTYLLYYLHHAVLFYIYIFWR